MCALFFFTTACNSPHAPPPVPEFQRQQLSALASRSVTAGEMVLIDAGEFIRGSNNSDESGKQQEYGLINPLYLDEHPQHVSATAAYYIDKYEVSNAQYKQFISVTKRAEPFSWTQSGYNLLAERLKATDLDTLRWIASEYFKFDIDTTRITKRELLHIIFNDLRIKDEMPVTGVTWHDARAYCHWANKRLPSEAEWEKAARGRDGLEYPWGNEWDISKTNVGDNSDWPGGVVPIGLFAQNHSPYGVADLSGNVWEWVEDWYQPYPGSSYQHEAFGEKNKVLRGGGGGIGHYALSVFFRGAARSFAPPATSSDDIGFRCAKSAE